MIPALYRGKPVNFTAQTPLDDEPPIAGGREIWDFPKKHGQPKPAVKHDTLTGTLDYSGVQVAVGTMGYKHQHLLYDVAGKKQCSSTSIIEKMSKTQVNLRLIPGVDGAQVIPQLGAYNLTYIAAKGICSGPARLHLVPPTPMHL